jgi:hypothetical protein
MIRDGFRYSTVKKFLGSPHTHSIHKTTVKICLGLNSPGWLFDVEVRTSPWIQVLLETIGAGRFSTDDRYGAAIELQTLRWGFG